MLKGIIRRRPSPSLAISVIALFIALGGTTYAATGGNFILGQTNMAGNQTKLTASVSSATPGGGKVLQLTNPSTASGAQGLGITVGANKVPIVVNSSAGKATNLNADKLDGFDSTGFLGRFAQAADSDTLDGIDSTGFLSGSLFGESVNGAGSTGSAQPCFVGDMKLVAGNFLDPAWMPASGQLLPIAGNDLLFQAIGTTYGGDGGSNFGLPDLRAVTPNNMTWAICWSGAYPGTSG
jgi:hypothetical protein